MFILIVDYYAGVNILMECKVSEGFWSYIQYVWKYDKRFSVWGFLFFPSFIVINFLQVYLPKMVVQELEDNRSITYLITSVIVLMFCMMICTLIREKMRSRIKYGNRGIVQTMQNDFTKKLLVVDFKYLEDKRFQSVKNMTKESLFGGSIGDAQERAKLIDFMPELLLLISSIGNMLLYMFYLSKLSMWLLVLLLVIPILTIFNNRIIRKIVISMAEQGADAWQKLDYITMKTEDFSMAKDIRLYHMDTWMMKLSRKYLNLRVVYKKKELINRFLGQGLGILCYGLYYGCFFLCILFRFWSGDIKASDVIFYAGLGPALYQMLEYGICHGFIRISKISTEFSRFSKFMDYGENTENTDSIIQTSAPKIELQHVGYKYPDAKECVIDDLNITIEPGEKIAIVGVNGAGKTTLMKLICGLLHPTSGRILLGGKDMKMMEAQERYAWFSCAFQDIQFLPVSVLENIAMEKTNDIRRVWSCLEQAGIKEMIEGLPNKLDTLMEKSLNEGAVDFSGGQRQRLILARALYRNAGSLILDEPTAALDALAENEIYERYAEIAEDKTSFFVSHRLASTRFCDRILLLNQGQIEEEGTHEELLALGGLYAEMFDLQRKYYQEGNDGE